MNKDEEANIGPSVAGEESSPKTNGDGGSDHTDYGLDDEDELERILGEEEELERILAEMRVHEVS